MALLLITASVAFAATGGGHESGGFTWKDWVWPVINFAILFFILYHYGRRPAAEYFRKRTEMIEKSLREASIARETAQKALDEVREKLKSSDSEIEQIVEAARKSGHREKEALIEEGHRLRDKIIQQAKDNIDFELQKAKENLKSEAALLALEAAEKQIKEKLGHKEQEGIISDYIKQLESGN
ncbi:F0F1 ATP synthase subunit B [bacterium]|nr:F0F1 ATP synthase subunit B [bacterium]